MTVIDLAGYQTPRLSHFPSQLANHPTFFSSLADDAIDLADLAGLELLPWEELIVRESLGERTDGLWSAATVCLIVPRQNGKNVCVYARQLAGLFLLGEQIVHTAHEFATADDAWKQLKELIESCDLDDEMIHPHLHGGANVSLRHSNGGFIRYRARGNGAMRGLTKIGLFIADEAFAVTGQQMGAAKPIMQAADKRQLWLTSSAGFDESEVLKSFRDQGMAGSNPRLLFGEWSCPERSDPTDRENWKMANPSLGASFCTWEAMEENFNDLPVDQFAREHLGMWDDPYVNAVIDLNAWDACKEEDVAEGVAPEIPVDWTVACLDVAPDRSSWSAVIAGMRPDGRHHVEVVSNESGSTKGILPLFQRLRASSSPPKAVAVQAGGRAGDFGPELEQIGFKVTYFGSKEIANSTGQFEDDIVGGKLSHLDDPFLMDGLKGATKYQIGGDEEKSGGWGWLRKNSAVDITGIVACSYANRLLTLESVDQTLTKKKRGRMLGVGRS